MHIGKARDLFTSRTDCRLSSWKFCRSFSENVIGKFGNMKTGEARGFWREKEVSPNGPGYHDNHNAESYMEVSNSLGWAMAELLKKKKN